MLYNNEAIQETHKEVTSGELKWVKSWRFNGQTVNEVVRELAFFLNENNQYNNFVVLAINLKEFDDSFELTLHYEEV